MAPKVNKKATKKAAAAATTVVAPVSAEEKASNRYLPKKEAEVFRTILTEYENKKHKNGLVLAEQILSQYPHHGETLAMKGIFVHSLGNKEEGYALVKKGTVNDIQSHIIWHVHALMLRSDKRFAEAEKCYAKAVEIEKDSLALLNDLATLQAHLRHYPGYVQSRLQILRVQPRLRRNWVYLAVAQHLAGDLPAADRTLTHLEGMLREVPAREFDHGELLCYHAQILEEGGQYERCLQYLADNSDRIVDRNAYSVQRARLLLKLGRTEPADWAWELLLASNPESYEYIKQSVVAKGADIDATSPDGKLAALKVLDQLADKHPRSQGIRRLALELAEGDDFRARASAYLTSALSKGVPSLFADVKSLYSSAPKREAVGQLVSEFRQSLEKEGTFGAPASGDEDAVEASSVYLWTLYFLASHLSHPSGSPSADDLASALATIDQAIAHTPSLPELHLLRGRILKRAGDMPAALVSVREAVALDGQDRGLNSKLGKYLVRAGEIEEGEQVLGLFTKKDGVTPIEDLADMQCLWLLCEEGDSYAKLEQWGLALKRYDQVFKVYTEIEEDQYDFHSYCVRKSTLRGYLDMVRFADGMRASPRYRQAAKGAIQIYCGLSDSPEAYLPAPLTNGAAEAEAKRAAEAQAKKEAEEKAAKEKADKAKADKAKKAGKKGAKEEDEEEEAPAPAAVDEDPVGEKLLREKKPLAEAARWLAPLEKLAPEDVQTWVLSFEVHLRKEKPLIALQALRRIAALQPGSALLPPLVTRLALFAKGQEGKEGAAVAALKEALPEVLEGAEVAAYLDAQLQKPTAGAEHKLAVARGKLLLGDEQGAAAVAAQAVEGASLETATAAYTFLRSLPSAEKEAQAVREQAAKRFPLARAFKLASEDEAAAGAQEDPTAGKGVVEE